MRKSEGHKPNLPPKADFHNLKGKPPIPKSGLSNVPKSGSASNLPKPPRAQASDLSIDTRELKKQSSGGNVSLMLDRSIVDPLADKVQIKVYARVRPTIGQSKFSDLRSSNKVQNRSGDPSPSPLIRSHSGPQNPNDSFNSGGQKDGATYEIHGHTNITWPHRHGDKILNDRFSLSRVFDQQTSQDMVYEFCAKAVVENFLKGYNGAVIAYGQTTSGKTYTMQGPEDNLDDRFSGIIPRSLEHIFLNIEWNKGKNIELEVSMSVFEIYAEKIIDLLASAKNKKDEHKIRVNEKNEVHITGLTEVKLTAAEQVNKCMMRASKHRSVGANVTNKNSSRSH
jgi:hypothetical protein